MPRYAARTDVNQKPIVSALRAIFGPDAVLDLSAVGRGCPDIMVGVRRRNLLMEIKTDKGSLTADQVYFHREWSGQVHIVRTLDDALNVIERETT